MSKYCDSRDKIPVGMTLNEYVNKIIVKLPTSTLTHRETYALKMYLEKYNGFIKCAISELNEIKERDCSEEVFNLVSNAISFLNTDKQ